MALFRPRCCNAWVIRAALAVLLALSLLPAPAAGRSAAQKHTFQRQHPCPSTGLHRSACPGYVIDHVQPLCAGGADSPTNMQWQTVADAKRKDVQERRECRAMGRKP